MFITAVQPHFHLFRKFRVKRQWFAVSQNEYEEREKKNELKPATTITREENHNKATFVTNE